MGIINLQPSNFNSSTLRCIKILIITFVTLLKLNQCFTQCKAIKLLYTWITRNYYAELIVWHNCTLKKINHRRKTNIGRQSQSTVLSSKVSRLRNGAVEVRVVDLQFIAKVKSSDPVKLALHNSFRNFSHCIDHCRKQKTKYKRHRWTAYY